MTVITEIGASYVAHARTIAAIATARQTRRVAKLSDFLDLGALHPPFCLWVFDGEMRVGSASNEAIGGATQQTEQQWSAYVGAPSFAPEGEGAFSAAAGFRLEDSADTLVGELVDTINGATVYLAADGSSTKAYFESAGYYDSSPMAVIYRVRFRNPFLRTQV